MILFSLLYDVSLFLLGLTFFPFFLYQKIFKGKYSQVFFSKLGCDFPKINTQERFVIWVHAVSVGETKAVSSLVRSLKKKYKNPLIIISSITETGHAEAKKSLACADYHVYLPFDFYWIITPIVKRVSPNLVIVSETDFWFNFLRAAKKYGAKIALVNGKMSKKSSRRLKSFSFFSKKLLGLFDLFCIQCDHYLPRFIDAGVSPRLLVVTGNLKLDDDYPDVKPEELVAWKEGLGIARSDKVIVIGSTHAPEEKQILEKLKPLWLKDSSLKVVVVPRHPERFEEVATILTDLNLPFTKFSEPKKRSGNENIVLIDAMGLLRKCYQFADVAIVAGSFSDKIGGHNIVEPCWYGVPTLFGPHMETQPNLVKLVEAFKAGEQVTIEDLPKTVHGFLQDNEKRRRVGDAGIRLAASSRGATKKTCDLLLKSVSSS
ncbi:MAG: 3-deoxy-D-manno-octulosonic acid transferase [Chlamydiota bacterium]|nr:3-deoxy-D-manno-octulosonic acid transferase [Chlamydiota bacterium]